MVLDDKGLRPARQSARKRTSPETGSDQYELPFVNQSVAGDKVHLIIDKKDSQNAEYVQVSLRIKVAG